MSNNVSDILKQLDTLNESTGVSIYLPSLKKSLKFKNLNLKQQKDLLKSSVDETLTKLSFIVNFYNIIQDNAIDTINVNDLYIFDRIAIALTLRASGLNSSYTLNDETHNLNDIIARIPNIAVSAACLTTTLDMKGLSVELEVPKLNIDRDISLATINKLKNNQDKDIKTLVGELFIHEIIKFVKSVTFKTEAGDQVTSFNTLKVEDKISIIEKFPASLTKQVLEFIKSYRDVENQFTAVGDSNIEIDGSFFSV
jgi:hypothetical protein